jgi:hypothetical protein
MKSKPILFSTPMIQAILEGRKTQTRRIVKPQPKQELDFFGWELHPKKLQVAFGTGNKVDSFHKFPFGQVGDVLWVRETFRIKHPWGHEAFGYYEYKTYNYQQIKAPDSSVFQSSPKWKPSIFMPKDAARIWLKITNIKIERLHDISEKDAILEGVEKEFSILFNEWRFKDYYNVKSDWRSAVSSFQSLWANINGINSWDDNPFVWVIEFERIEKPSEV